MTAAAESFTCPVCGATSHNPHDVRWGYCGACHDWTGDAVAQLTLDLDGPALLDGLPEPEDQC